MKRIAILGSFILMLCGPAQAISALCPIGLTEISHIRGKIGSVYPVILSEHSDPLISNTGIRISSGKKSTPLLLRSDTKFLLANRANISELKLNSNVILVGSVRLDITIMAIAIGLLSADMTGGQDRPWDRGPRSHFTQGRIISIENNELGLFLNVKIYEKFSRRFLVTSKTAIYTIKQTSQAALTSGQQVVAEAFKSHDCNLHANFIFIGVNGNTPSF